MSVPDFPNFFSPIATPDGRVSDVWFRRFQAQRQAVSAGFNIVVSPGLAASESAVAPGDTLHLTNTGVRSIAINQPTAGITVTGTGLPETLDVVYTLALANGTASLEGLTGTGLGARTGTDTWATVVLTGTSGAIDIVNGDGVLGNPTFNISATYPGQTSISTLGTVSAGIWQGTAVDIAYGGTGATSAASAFTALAPSQIGNNGYFLSTNGTTASWAPVTTGTVTSVAASVPAFLSVTGSPITSSGTLAINYSGAALPVLNGGTGATTSTGTGNAVLSNSPSFVTPNIDAATGTSVVLTSTGTASAFIPTGSGVPTNGMYLAAANTLTFGTNSTERVRITSTGFLGLNKTPAEFVDLVNPNGRAVIWATTTLAGNTAGVKLTATAGSAEWSMTAGTGSANLLTFSATTGSEVLRLNGNGAVSVTNASGTLGYGTGSGGTVTQVTSRTTGVTLNKASGAVTLVSAAGSASWQSFTVTNSLVIATDVIVVCQKSGTDLYLTDITAVGAGSFRISFATTGGTTTEQPVFNFVVIKAVTA